MSEVKKEKCFVITPIGSETDPIRRHIEGVIDAAIEPALGAKYEIIVAHKISTPGSITKQIISEIHKDKLVIANLTNNNPNVMYELAFRHSLGLPTIMIAEKGTKLPSDIIMQRTIFYNNDAKGVLELIDEIKKAEEEINFDKKSGPIFEILGDIKHDDILLQQVKNKENEDVEPLQYILARLNRIEDAIISNRRASDFHPDKDVGGVRIVTATFKYTKATKKVDVNAVEERLAQTIEERDPRIEILNVDIDRSIQQIDIDTITRVPYLHPIIRQYFIDVLVEFGFEGVKFLEEREL